MSAPDLFRYTEPQWNRIVKVSPAGSEAIKIGGGRSSEPLPFRDHLELIANMYLGWRDRGRPTAKQEQKHLQNVVAQATRLLVAIKKAEDDGCPPIFLSNIKSVSFAEHREAAEAVAVIETNARAWEEFCARNSNRWPSASQNATDPIRDNYLTAVAVVWISDLKQPLHWSDETSPAIEFMCAVSNPVFRNKPLKPAAMREWLRRSVKRR